MSQSPELVDDLRDMIRRKQVTAVVGAGVSLATTSMAPIWNALIRSGIKRCSSVLNADADWGRFAEQGLEVGSLDTLLSAAELVDGKLKENGGGEFARWLRGEFENLTPEDSSVIDALAALNLPLVTTNYDGLLESVTGLKSVTWRDAGKVTKVIRRDDRRVLHLHGHWEEPESVVLGIRSYVAVTGHEHTQAVMKALGATSSFLFVGCGDDGLSDPNWGRFLEWLRQFDTDAGNEHRHYRLVRESEKFDPVGRLFPLVYGADYDDLAPFLGRLLPESPDETGDGSGKSGSRVLPVLTDAVSDYLHRLVEQTAYLELLGLGRSLQVELPIAEAYVPLRTTLHRSFETKETDRFQDGHAEVEAEVDLGSVFRRSSELGLRGVVLLGEPGSGKTTGAKQLAWRLASRQSLPRDLGLPDGTTPVMLKFRELSPEVLQMKQRGLRKFLEQQTHCPDAAEGLENPGPDLLKSEGGLLWILDGLDEVVDPDARRKVSGWVQGALKNRPNDRFLVTCRFQGYYRQGVPLGAKFAEFHVRPLDDDQIQEFVTDWFSAAYRKLYGPGDDASARAADVRGKLLKTLELPRYQTGGMRELCTNPLLLTILCIVFHEERKLPTERAELYSRCVRVLLEHWRREIYDSDNGPDVKAYDADAAQAVLARMAWWMHQTQDRTAAPLDELAAEAERGLASVAASSGLGRDGRTFIDRMRDEAGILAMSGEGDGRCGFLHLSFQEYLAATYASSNGLAEDLASQAVSSWWRETALLSLRSSEPYCREFFAVMLEAGIAEDHPELADQCLDEALFIPPEPFVELLRRKQTKAARKMAILRMLKSRLAQLPEVAEVAQELTKSKNRRVVSLASEMVVSVRTRAEIESFTAGPVVPPHEGLSPGDVWVNPRTGIAYSWIPAGTFLMGEDDGQEAASPRHQVELTQPFWLARYPVTNAQYRRFLEEQSDQLKKPENWDNRRFNGDEQPVVGVSWDEAVRFAKWAESALPTEAQWEYACRAGTSTHYCFGDDDEQLGEYAWYGANSNSQAQPVGTMQANAWGLHDMHGNVWEWCHDFWSDNYADAASVDPAGPASGSNRVFRGGGWLNSARYCRSAIRNWGTPSFRDNHLGFRVAAVPEVAGGGASVE